MWSLPVGDIMINFYRYYPGLLDKNEIQNGISLIEQLIRGDIESITQDALQPVLHLIKRSPFTTYIYARDVIKDRFYEAEPLLLAADDSNTFVYSDSDVSWFAKLPNILVWYSLRVMESRWIEAEDIMKDSVAWDEYANRFEI